MRYADGMNVGGEYVLQLGAPALRQPSASVVDVASPGFRERLRRLHRALAGFRQAKGFGRAIAAPQIGMPERFIAVDLGDGPFAVINPVITWRSDETFTLWDDCMSFPDLLVRVRRHRSISLSYVDETGAAREWSRLAVDTSELMQHEIDHLDGVLAVDRAERPEDVVERAVFAGRRAFYDARVDGVPQAR